MIQRGFIYWTDLNPVIGSEIGKTRPSIVVSNDINNRYGSTVTIVPISSTVVKIYPTDVLLKKGEAGLTNDSKPKADQIRTVDKRRIGKSIGEIPVAKMQLIEEAILIHLNISL
jgi:mRNA interferase MazF